MKARKTAIHEIAHATLHAIDKDATPEELADRPDRRTREVQAESVAYAVCQHYGLDTSDYSFGYVAGWSSGKELSELKASLETIRATANDLINVIALILFFCGCWLRKALILQGFLFFNQMGDRVLGKNSSQPSSALTLHRSGG